MNLAQHLVVALIRVYRAVLSPAKTVLFGSLGRCRYDPTCSTYALEAVRAHGMMRGLWLAARRLCRCHPWGGAGHDPVPPAHLAPAETSTPHLPMHNRRRPARRPAEALPRQGLA